MRMIGQKPMRVQAFAEYIRDVCGLLRGEEVDYTLNGVTHPIWMVAPPHTTPLTPALGPANPDIAAPLPQSKLLPAPHSGPGLASAAQTYRATSHPWVEWCPSPVPHSVDAAESPHRLSDRPPGRRRLLPPASQSRVAAQGDATPSTAPATPVAVHPRPPAGAAEPGCAPPDAAQSPTALHAREPAGQSRTLHRSVTPPPHRRSNAPTRSTEKTAHTMLLIFSPSSP
jgi:hypothetical protein